MVDAGRLITRWAKGMKNKRAFLLIILILIGATLLLLNNKRYDHNQREFLATVLNIEQLPNSFQIESYSSHGFTDTLETCVSQISPNDFVKLISGRAFVKTTATGTFHDYFYEKKIGKAYHASELYVVSNPHDFENGGNITLVVNSNKTKIGIDIFIE